MRILSRHIGLTITNAILMVLLVLIGVEIFLELANELRQVGKGNFTLWMAISNVPLMLPSDIYQLFPMAALIGSLIGLGRLAAQSELVVMLSAGYSKFQIILSILKSMIFLLLIVSFLGELIGPKTLEWAKNRKASAISKQQTLRTTEGVWYRDNNNFIFIKEIEPNYELRNVNRYQLNDNLELTLTSFAEKARYANKHWTFYNVHQSEIHDKNVKSEFFKEQDWKINLGPHLLGVMKTVPNQMTMKELYDYVRFRHHNHLTIGLFEFELWKRLMQPFATMVMIFMAVPFIFGPLRSTTMGFRLIIGVVVGFVFYILNQFLGPLSLVYQIPPVLAAILPTLLFAMIGCFLLFLKA